MALGDLTGGARASASKARAVAQQDGDPEALGRTATGLCDGLRRAGQLAERCEIALEGAEVRGGRAWNCTSACAGSTPRRPPSSSADGTSWIAQSARCSTRNFAGMTLDLRPPPGGRARRARGDLAGAAAASGRRVQRRRTRARRPPASYAIDAEAELALWERRPEAALPVAEEGLRQSRSRTPAMGGHRRARRARRGRPRRARPRTPRQPPPPPHASARPRFRDGARDRAADAAHPALAATIEAEHARAAGATTIRRCGTPPPRVGGAAGPVPGRLRALAPGRGRARARPRSRRRRRGAARRARHRREPRRATPARRDRSPGAPRADRVAARRGRCRAGRSADPGRGRRGPRPHRPRARGPPAPRAAATTNRQIADALYISVRTAGVHVSHILSKLSAANRGEAAAIAHRLGLVP